VGKLIDGEVPCLVAIELAVALRYHRGFAEIAPVMCLIMDGEEPIVGYPEERCARRRRNRFVREVEVDVEVGMARGGASDEASDGTLRPK
jgi:hypothetical protein